MNTTTEKVGWVAEPNGRGTLGLLISCGTTIFLCTYSAVHPNLPGLNDSEWTIFWRQTKYLFTCICAPEVYTMMALHVAWKTKRLAKTRKLMNPTSRSPWSLKQYFFASMGGYAVQINPTTQRIFQPNDLLELIQSGVVEMPALEDQDIEDRSKASWITKSIALLQVAWFLAQLLARAIENIPITTLELYTLGIVGCAILIYACNWEKPFDVRRPVVLQTTRTKYPWPKHTSRIELTNTIASETWTKTEFLLTAVIVILIFSVPHLLGWNFVFASTAEQWIWRIGSLCCAVQPLLIVVPSAYKEIDDMAKPGRWFVFANLFLYMAIRIAMLVEIFVGLRSVPVGVYETPQWSNYFPSFGT